MGRISMFGEQGDYAAFKGHDLQALALSGLLYIVGEPDRHPLPLPGVQASYSAGLALLSGVMVCVWAADRKPEFREIVTSGVRAAAYLDWKSQIYFEAEGKVLVRGRSEEHTSELQSLMRISYAVFCLKKKKSNNRENYDKRK